MTTSMYFQCGDLARYHGDVQGCGENIVIAGDLVTVYEGNADEDDDVWVTRDCGAPIPVSGEHLEWISRS